MVRTLMVIVAWLLLEGAARAESEPTPEEDTRELAPATRTVGWLEPIVVDGKVKLTAKLDTGAKASALDAEEPIYFEKDGQRWVRFGLREHGHGAGKAVTLEARVTGEKKIRPSSGEVFTRATIELPICLGGEQRVVEFTLGDRTSMTYRLLLGRDALAGHLAVDSGRRFTSAPGCDVPAKKKESK